MSDFSIRKHCKYKDSPTSPVGYWMKLQNGKKSPQTKTVKQSLRSRIDRELGAQRNSESVT